MSPSAATSLKPLPTPDWDQGNLVRHHFKRITKDAGCFESLLGITGRSMTKTEYQARAAKAVQHAVFDWVADVPLESFRAYPQLSTRCYFVDDQAVLAVLNQHRTKFFTCFHKHFRHPHGIDPRPGESAGQIALKLSRWIDHQVATGKVINPRRKNGFA